VLTRTYSAARLFDITHPLFAAAAYRKAYIYHLIFVWRNSDNLIVVFAGCFDCVAGGDFRMPIIMRSCISPCAVCNQRGGWALGLWAC
jgi:hypothetical protein